MTATTQITHNPDSGASANWAYDDITRTLTITAGTDCGTVPLGDTCYDATIADTGTFNAVTGALTPNQSGSYAGEQIATSVSGPMTGSSGYNFYAPTADAPSASNVAAYFNANYTTYNSGPDSTNQWYLQAFTPADQSAVAGTGIENNWQWSYKTSVCGEAWADTYANGGGDLAGDGNITGRPCVTGYTSVGTVVNKASGKCLDVTGGAYAVGADLQQWTCGAKGPDGVAGEDQNFRIASYSNGTTALQAMNGTTPYDVQAAASGDTLALSADNNSPFLDQQLTKSGPYYEFEYGTATVANDSNGTAVTARPLASTTAQQWSLP